MYHPRDLGSLLLDKFVKGAAVKVWSILFPNCAEFLHEKRYFRAALQTAMDVASGSAAADRDGIMSYGGHDVASYAAVAATCYAIAQVVRFVNSKLRGRNYVIEARGTEELLEEEVQMAWTHVGLMAHHLGELSAQNRIYELASLENEVVCTYREGGKHKDLADTGVTTAGGRGRDGASLAVKMATTAVEEEARVVAVEGSLGLHAALNHAVSAEQTAANISRGIEELQAATAVVSYLRNELDAASLDRDKKAESALAALRLWHHQFLPRCVASSISLDNCSSTERVPSCLHHSHLDVRNTVNPRSLLGAYCVYDQHLQGHRQRRYQKKHDGR